MYFELCDSGFWDANLTWYTEQPQLTACFRNTFLVWFPASLLLLAVISEFYSIRRARLKEVKSIPWNYFNSFRLSIVVFLLSLKLFQISSDIYYILVDGFEYVNGDVNNNHVIILSTILSPIIQATSYLILMILYLNHRKAGINTSGPTWFYLFASFLCEIIEFYSVITNYNNNQVVLNDIEYYIKLIHFPILTILFLFECRGDTPIIKVDYTDLRPTSSETQASFLSSITFWWYNKFLIYGYRNKLNLLSLWKTLDRDNSSELVPVFEEEWCKTRASSKKKTYNSASGVKIQYNNVAWVVVKLFWAKLLFAACLKLSQDSLQFMTPMILKRLVGYMSDKKEAHWHGILYALLFLIIPTTQSLLLCNYFYYIQVIGLQIRTMLIGFVYRKSLSLSGSSRIESTSGEIVNLMAVDSQRYQDLLMYVNLFWSAPYQITLAIILLYRELGWSVFAGVICMALVLPMNAYLANRYKLKQVKVMKIKDERVKQMNEILNGIKVIKLYAWENSFINNILALRSKELEYLKRILRLEAYMSFLWQCSPFVVALVTFTVYVNASEGNVLTPVKAFVSISLFHLLKFPLTVLPSLVTSFVLTVVSTRRLNKFFNSDELINYVTRNEELEAISIEGGTLSWSHVSDGKKENSSSSSSLAYSSSKNVILKDIDLHVKPKSFVAIVGQVASGKSSLISAIIGEMHRIAGRFNICKDMSIAYVPQQAWIQNMTVRDNILFGKPYNEECYKQVLSVCSLQSDLDTLPGGDLAEIGEKGINLSGGQKQRVSLARACYSNSEIFLLDDPLSALDSHVAKHVFEKVLSSTTGLLRNKTRVLATNSLFVLPHVDHIIVLDNGRIVESGSYKDLIKIERGYFAESMRQYSGKQESAHVDNNDDDGKSNDKNNVESIVDQKSFEQILAQEEKIMKSIAPVPADASGRLIETEKTETGSVTYSIYLQYFKALSLFWLTCNCISLLSASAFGVSSNLWLSSWSGDSDDPANANDKSLRDKRIIIYACLGGGLCVSVLSGSLALSRGAIRASKRIHSSLLDKVMHSPMNFFDTTPMGRIVNRFAKDIDVVDTTIPSNFVSSLNCLLQVLSTLFIICYSFPTFLIILLPLTVVYYLIQKVFIVTTRQLKRLESTTRSPIYSNFSETLTGISTIRAYNCVERFVNNSDNRINTNQSCTYPNIIANRWLSVRLELFGNIITACAALFSVYYKGVIMPNVVGLTISYSMSITQTLSWLVRMSSDLETNIVSVERICEYLGNKQEDLWIKDDKRPPSDWPNKGLIKIEDYSTKYREDTDLVLKALNINIKAGEKIGIVGRTGSGKSSLSLSLFRILEPAAGKIIIDDLNIVDYGLHDLRSRLTIIPQDPILFSGTLRFNLDPLKLYSDAEIWRSLELSHLKNYVTSLDLGLDYKVTEYGENFSVGQRQLICLARAILRKSKILILDEATASVDLETDSIVQRTIREIFNDCTIITIAHRLHTILDSDRILVLDKGCVLELDSPKNLISNVNTAFSSLVRDAGITTTNNPMIKK